MLIAGERVDVRRILQRAVLFFLTLFVVASFSHLSMSLWIDEVGPWYLLRSSLRETVVESYTEGQHPPLYQILLWFVTHAFGSGELSLRFLSVLSGLFVGLLFYRLLRSEFGKNESLSATILLLAAPDVTEAVLSARPYALALLFACCSIFSFRRWTISKSWKAAALTGALCGIVVDLHLLYGTIFIAYSVSLFLVARRDRSRILPALLPFLVSGFLVSLPAVPTLFRLFHSAASSNYLEHPDFIWLGAALLPPGLMALFVPWLLFKGVNCYLRSSEWDTPRLTAAEHSLFPIMAALYAVPVALSFIGSNLTASASVWSVRHFLFYWLGLSYVITWFLKLLGCGEKAFLVFSIFILAFADASLVREAKGGGENWREAVAALNAEKNPGAMVLVNSGYIENDNSEFYRSQEQKDHLTSPVRYYGLENVMTPFPWHANSLRTEAKAAVDLAVEKGRTFYLLNRFTSPENLAFITDILHQSGQKSFSVDKLKFGNLELVKFHLEE